MFFSCRQGNKSHGLRLSRFRSAQPARYFSSQPFAASILIQGEADAEQAAAQAATLMKSKFHDGTVPNFTLWFAKGYGPGAQRIGHVLQQKLASGGNGVVIGASGEAGIIGDGQEIQKQPFGLSVLSLNLPGVQVLPFHSADMASLPNLGRGGSWSDLSASTATPSILAFCGESQFVGPQEWCTMFDKAVYQSANQSEGKRLPTVVGGMTVGNHIFVDGDSHAGGAFGVALLPGADSKTSFDVVVCQGAVPFGPTLRITGVAGPHVISELDHKNPRQLLEPLMRGPHVPASGYTMAGVFVDQLSQGLGSPLAAVSMSGRPNCVVRPLHSWTPEGYIIIQPILDDVPYTPGMQLQLHCMNKDLALEDLRMRAGFDVMAHGGVPPDAAVVISCAARGVSLYGEEGVESGVLRQAWGFDVPTTGFFAGGEFGPVGSKTFMHGYTTSCLFMRVGSK